MVNAMIPKKFTVDSVDHDISIQNQLTIKNVHSESPEKQPLLRRECCGIAMG
jgi:hypothetical protein